MTKRIAVIGAGTMGGRYAGALATGELGDATLAAVCDLDLAAAERAAGPHGLPAFADAAEMLAAVRPDAVYIATPDHLHRAPAEAVFAAGIPALIEKPLATTVEDAEAIVAAAGRAGVAAEVNFSNRWNPPFLAAKQAAVDGRIGELVTVTARLNNTIVSPRDRLAWAGGTTPAWFLMSHCLDLAYWLGGRRARSVYAAGRRGLLDGLGVPTWDSIQALVRYEGGGTGTFEATWTLPESLPAPIEFELRLVGTSGAATVNTGEQMVRIAAERWTTPPVLAWTAARFRAFLQTLDGAAPVVPLADGLENTRLLVAVHRSLESGAVEPV